MAAVHMLHVATRIRRCYHTALHKAFRREKKKMKNSAKIRYTRRSIQRKFECHADITHISQRTVGSSERCSITIVSCKTMRNNANIDGVKMQLFTVAGCAAKQYGNAQTRYQRYMADGDCQQTTMLGIQRR